MPTLVKPQLLQALAEKVAGMDGTDAEIAAALDKERPPSLRDGCWQDVRAWQPAAPDIHARVDGDHRGQ